jgi:hypothetical protein
MLRPVGMKVEGRFMMTVAVESKVEVVVMYVVVVVRFILGSSGSSSAGQSM